MRKVLHSILALICRLTDQAASRLYTPPRDMVLDSWHEANGDKTLRLEYDLMDESLVFDLGGYEGQWASDIYSKYGCSLHVFEPVPEYAENIQKRFQLNKKITIHPYGLSDVSRSARMALRQASSSLYKPHNSQDVEIQLIRAADFFVQHGIKSIDLMKINIEGGEDDLLEHLLKTGYITKIRNIQVQFHNFVPDAFKRMRDIQEELSNTHFLTYQYPFVWENWSIKSVTAPIIK